MSDQDEAVAITIVGETQAPDLLVEGNAELFVRNTDGSEEAPPPALPAGPRPVDENAALPADYPARGSRYRVRALLRFPCGVAGLAPAKRNT